MISLTLTPVFEIGSAVRRIHSHSFWNRAIAGLGAPVSFNVAVVPVVYTGPLHKQSMYMGFVSAIFGASFYRKTRWEDF